MAICTNGQRRVREGLPVTRLQGESIGPFAAVNERIGDSVQTERYRQFTHISDVRFLVHLD
jgi:hypothetical protein